MTVRVLIADDQSIVRTGLATILDAEPDIDVVEVSRSDGPHDCFTLWEAHDNVSMAAVALSIGAGGALSPCETAVLLTVEESLDALYRARQIRYRPPGS
jgi:DNA-binding NarL/FixJ family response regulator